ncbi:MAG: RNA methyltransferase [Desulfobacterales bacterium SG8_35]|nr:MAG: RNA methyltransferase [Desulfobacterales bacterium SG8_35]
MAYNEKLSQRVRAILLQVPGIEIKKMFGGVGFLLHGNMACGILDEYLIVRVGPDGYEEALALPHTGKFDITGRVMKGWIMVAKAGWRTEKDLSTWVQRGVSFAKSLPKK